jgi:hypothetical protein
VAVVVGGVVREIQRELGKAMTLLAWEKGAQRCTSALRVDAAALCSAVRRQRGAGSSSG